MDQVAARVRKVVGATEIYRRAVADSLGVSDIELITLSELWYHGARTPSALAERIGLTSPSVTALVDRLEHAGLASRRRHPVDRRSVLVELTTTGAATLRAMFNMFSSDVAAAVRIEAPEHIAVFNQLLEQIAGALLARAADRPTIDATLRNTTPHPEPVTPGTAVADADHE
jgi:DNA-binding MarR family transcriptional regulator